MTEFRKKSIGFFTDGVSFDGSSLDKGALGGSETALVQMARALSRQGHEVTVFNRCLTPGVHHGVAYHPVEEFSRFALASYFDVFLVSRYFGFFRVPIKAGLKVLWNHDTLDRPKALREMMDRFDFMWVLSDFHRQNYLTLIPELEAKTLVTRNGLDLELIDRAVTGIEKDPNLVVYASRPERGLKVLLERIWPRLVAARPEATLALCGYQVGGDHLAPGLTGVYARVDELVATTPRVVHHGALGKVEYYQLLARASAMVYPCTFPEISCLAVLEAQACGTPVVTTDGFALSESALMPEYRIPGRPGTVSYDEAFLARTIDVLDRGEWAGSLAEKARAEIEKRYPWSVIASEWNRVFDLFLRSRQPGTERSIK